MSCGPSGTGWGAGGLCSGDLNSGEEELVGAQGSFCDHGTQSLERVSDLPKVTQLVTEHSSWASVGVAAPSGFHLLLGGEESSE